MRNALVVGLSLALAACSSLTTDAEILPDQSADLQALELTSGTSFGSRAEREGSQ